MVKATLLVLVGLYLARYSGVVVAGELADMPMSTILITSRQCDSDRKEVSPLAGTRNATMTKGRQVAG